MPDPAHVSKEDVIGLYRFKRDAEGKLTRLSWAHNDAEIAIDPRSDEYCAFLDFAANQRPAVALHYGLLRPNCRYFGSEKALSDYLKQSGRLLFVIRNRGSVGILQVIDPMNPDHFGIEHPPGVVKREGNNPTAVAFIPLIYAAADLDDPPRQRDRFMPVTRSEYLTDALMQDLNKKLGEDPGSDIWALCNWPVMRSFVYVDVSDFSRQPAAHQAIIINTLTRITNPGSAPMQQIVEIAGYYESRLCIGDGYIFVFADAGGDLLPKS